MSFFLYWASLPPSWIGWAVFLVPSVWAATVFNPDFCAFVKRSGKNAEVAKVAENGETEKKRRFRRTRRFARFLGRVFFGGEYRQYWTAAFAFWAATVVWISYPHPATTFGWLAASAYLAIYFPLFVAITRALTGEKGTWNDATAENRKKGEDEESGEVEKVGESARITQTAQAVSAERNDENATVGKAAPLLTLKVRQTTQNAQNAKTARKAQTMQSAQITQRAKVGEIAQEAQKEGDARAAKRFGLPLWLAAPIAWTAVEWLRNRGLGGFSFAGLSHSVYDFPQFIQIAEPFGEYGIGAAIVAVGTLLGTAFAAAVSRSCASEANKADEANKAVSAEGGDSANGAKRRELNGAKWKRVAFSALGAVAMFGVVVGFGAWRIEFFDAAERSAVKSGAVPCRVALLQDGTTYRFPVPDWQNTQVAETYLALAAEAGRDSVGFDVVVWPESCFDVFWDEKTTAEPANGANAASSAESANEVNAAVRENGANGRKTANSAVSENGENAVNAANSAVSATAEVERIARAEKSRALSRSRRDAARLTERLGASAILGTTALLVDVDAGDETTVFNAAVFAPRLDSATVAALGGEYVDFDAAVPANEAGETGESGELGGLGGTANAEKSGRKASWEKYVDWKTPASTAPNDPSLAAFRLYGKRRLVICGEYIPGADLLPDWFPLKAVCADFSLERGAGPVVFPVVRRVRAAENGGVGENGGIGGVGESVEVGAIRKNEKDGANGEKAQNRENEQVAQAEPLLFAPHICFESSIPHYVKEQVRELTAAGAEPDVLVCLSNDGWFRNGSQTDGHLATQVFRAVENRKPVVAATHGGFSAHVDQAGRVRSRGARGGTEVVAAEVLPVDCARLGKRALLGGRDLAETLALGCVLLGLGALVVRKVGGRREKLES
ncbi:MAG: hypothetical protein IKK39_12490 [Thermoguttaceae bacterium]|nr:hypothetical protein [Thermoguttaceae bacterium]